MTTFLHVEDLEPFGTFDYVKADAMIADAEALAVAAAPCLATPGDLSDAQLATVKAVLRQAIVRWQETGSGAVQQQSAGPFGMTVDTRQPRRGMFWPSELDQLQTICTGGGTGKAYTVSTESTETVGPRWWVSTTEWVPQP